MYHIEVKYQKCIRYKTIAVLLKYFFLTCPFLNLLMLHCLIYHVKVNDVTLTFIELKVKAMAHFRLCTKTTQALCVASYILTCVWLWVKLMEYCIVMILFWLSNLEASMVQYCTWVLDKHSAKYIVQAQVYNIVKKHTSCKAVPIFIRTYTGFLEHFSFQ